MVILAIVYKLCDIFLVFAAEGKTVFVVWCLLLIKPKNLSRDDFFFRSHKKATDGIMKRLRFKGRAHSTIEGIWKREKIRTKKQSCLFIFHTVNLPHVYSDDPLGYEITKKI